MSAAGTARIYRTTLANRSLRRVLLAFLLFNAMEYAVWIAVTLFAFEHGGATTAGIILVVQLVPAAMVAPLAAAFGDRMRRDHALALGYGAQAVANLILGAAMLLAPPLAAYFAAIIASCAITVTRPVHNSILPDLANTPEELTAANSASGTVEGLGLLIGPLANAILIAIWGTPAVALVFALVMVPAAAMTWRLRLHEAPSGVPAKPVGILRTALGGLHELRRDRDAVVLTVLGGAQFVLLGMLDLFYAILAIDLLGIGASGAGPLAAAVGVGGLLGAAGTALLVGRSRLAGPVEGALAATGILLAVVAYPSRYAVALLLLAAVGCARSFFDVAARTLLQRSVRADLLSRVFGLQEGLMMLGTALGSAIVPVAVAIFGIQGAFVAAGAIPPVVAVATYASLRRLDRRALLPDPERLGLLSSIALFQPLPQAQLELVSRRLTPAKVYAGTPIIREGDAGDRFYILTAGEALVTSGGASVARIGPGGSFGEIALLRGVPRTASVTAATDVRMLVLGREDFLLAVTGSRPSMQAAERTIERYLGELGRPPD